MISKKGNSHAFFCNQMQANDVFQKEMDDTPRTMYARLETVARKTRDAFIQAQLVNMYILNQRINCKSWRGRSLLSTSSMAELHLLRPS